MAAVAGQQEDMAVAMSSYVLVPASVMASIRASSAPSASSPAPRWRIAPLSRDGREVEMPGDELS